MQLDARFEGLEPFFDARKVFFGAEPQFLLLGKLFLRGIKLLLLLRQFLLEDLAAPGIALLLGLIVYTRKIGRLRLLRLLRLAARCGGLRGRRRGRFSCRARRRRPSS